jgi:Kef-type K+ transport system membrane component KefB
MHRQRAAMAWAVLSETGREDDDERRAVSLLALVSVKVFNVDTGSFLVIVVTAAVAGTIAAVAGGRGLFLPVVVLELVLGVVVGPQGLGLAGVNGFTGFFSDLGLGLLFFFAGYEIDIPRIRGRPLKLALMGWVMSLAIAYGVGSLLAAAGIVLSLVYVGSALATTAVGTLIPVLSDTGELDSDFGTYLLAAGAVGEFGPVLLLTLVLSAQSPAHSAVILIAFIALAVVVAVVAVRSAGHTMPLLEQTIEKSSQLAVRWIVVLVFALTLLASHLGLDLLLGGFAAGMITRLVLRKHEVPGFDSKLTAIAFGVFIPFFFIISGMRLDVDALFSGPGSVAKMLLFFVLFLVVRGTPAMLLYRKVLPLREDRMALALFTSTQLPLVVAITALAVGEGHMRPSTAAALVGAGALSTLAGPLHGLRMRRIASLKRLPNTEPPVTVTGAQVS